MDPFRNELDAAHAKIAHLETKIAKRREPISKPYRPSRVASFILGLCLGAFLALVFGQMAANLLFRAFGVTASSVLPSMR